MTRQEPVTRDRSRVLAALLAASLGWGLAGVGTRAVFAEGVTTFTVITVRTVTATVAVVAVALALGFRSDRTAWRDGTIIGIFRIGLAPTFFIASLQYVSAGVEGIFITLIPATTAVLAALVLHERLDRNQVLGLFLGLAGTLLIVSSGESGIAAGEGNVVVGGMLALGGVVAAAISGVASRRYAPRHRTADLAMPMFISGTAVAVGAGTLLRDISFQGIPTHAWALMVALGLGSTLLPFFLTLYASKHTTAARVALTGYLAPVVGVVAGALILDEVLTPAIITGAVLALAGIALVGRGRRPRTALSQ